MSALGSVALDRISSFFGTLITVAVWGYGIMDRFKISQTVIVVGYNVVYRIGTPAPA